MRAQRWLLATDGSLKSRIFRGGFWLMAGDILARASSLIKIAVLARILAPTDFGLMGIALVVLRGVEYFTQTGFNAAMIQKRGDIGPYLNTAWTVQLLRGVGISAGLYFGAPLGAWFFENPGTAPLIRALALVTLLRGAANPMAVYLRKELDFRREVAYKVAAMVIGLAVAVPVALIYRSVWALMISMIVTQAAESVGTFVVLPYKPRIELDRTKLRELTGFGKWIFWSNILAFLTQQFDSLAVAKLLGATALGFYQTANQFAMVPTSELGMHIRGLMLPAFSKLEDPAARRRGFLRSLEFVVMFLVPIACFVTVFAQPFVLLVLGERWTPMAPLLRILVWAGVVSAVSMLASALFQSAGRPSFSVYVFVVRLAVLAAMFYPLLMRFGNIGMAYAVLASAAAGLCCQFVALKRLLEVRSLQVFTATKVGVLGSLPFLAVAPLVNLGGWRWVALSSIVAVALYLLVLFLFVRARRLVPAAGIGLSFRS